MILSGATSPGLCGPLSHGNEGDTRWWGVLPLCRDVVGVFYSEKRLGHIRFVNELFVCCLFLNE